MEELALYIIVEIGGFLLNAIIYFPWDFLMVFFEERSKKPTYLAAILLSILTGTLIGYISVKLIGGALIPFDWLRLINLILAPFVAGYIALLTSRRREKKRKSSDSKFHYIVAFLFTLSFIATRYVLTTK